MEFLAEASEIRHDFSRKSPFASMGSFSPWHFLWLPFLGASQVSLGCINDYVPNTKAIAASRDLAKQLTQVELFEPWEARRDRLLKEVGEGSDYKLKNDLASALMHTGNPKAAIQLLENIEATNPGLYQTASNLGTALELAGDNTQALKWIREGIRRDPGSHDSSEWIHVKILEAKNNPARTGDPLVDCSVLGLPFGFGPRPERPATLPSGNRGEPLSLDAIESGLKYQLRERLQFAKPPDWIVASLLFDLGNIITLKSGNPGTAQGIYELALQYAAPPANGSASEQTPLSQLISFRYSTAARANWVHSFFATPEFKILLVGAGVISFALLLRFLSHRRASSPT